MNILIQVLMAMRIAHLALQRNPLRSMLTMLGVISGDCHAGHWAGSAVGFQVIEIRVVQRKLALEGTI